MRVLLSCLQSKVPHPIPAYSFWRTYFVEGLREAGMDVLEIPDVDWAEALTYTTESQELAEWRSRTWEAALAFAKKEQEQGGVDLFLSYLYPDQVDVGAVRELQRAGIPCVNFFCDNVREFRKVPAAYTPFDLHWVPEFEALPMYRCAHLPHIHAPMPCWVPKRYRSVPGRENGLAVFIGSADLLRRNLLGEASLEGANIKVYGKGWQTVGKEKKGNESKPILKSYIRTQAKFIQKYGLIGAGVKTVDKIFPPKHLNIPNQNVGGLVSQSEYVELTRESSIVLGINRAPSFKRPLRYPLRYSRLRDIEAPMLGSCYLTEFTEGLASLYEVGVEVETYRSISDLSKKINELLAHPDRRSKLRLYGQRRAIMEHSIPSTLQKIFKRLGCVH